MVGLEQYGTTGHNRVCTRALRPARILAEVVWTQDSGSEFTDDAQQGLTATMKQMRSPWAGTTCDSSPNPYSRCVAAL